MKNFRFPLICLSLLCLSDIGWADSPSKNGQEKEKSLFVMSDSRTQQTTQYRFVPQRLFLRNVQESGHGFGDVKNYSTLAMLLGPSFRKGRVLSMLDVRGHSLEDTTDERKYAWNIGYVGRYIPLSKCRLIGFNAFLDFRQGCLDNWYRSGLGIEVLGKRWDFRLNTYFPFGEKCEKEKCGFNIDGFFSFQRTKEFIYTGFNTEVGYLAIPWKQLSLYTSIGPYFVNGGCGSDAWGGQLRLRTQYKDFISLEFSLSHDRVFTTVYQGKIVFSLPLYSKVWQKHQKGPCDIRQQLIYQPVERFDIIPLKKHTRVKKNF